MNENYQKHRKSLNQNYNNILTFWNKNIGFCQKAIVWSFRIKANFTRGLTIHKKETNISLRRSLINKTRSLQKAIKLLDDEMFNIKKIYSPTITCNGEILNRLISLGIKTTKNEKWTFPDGEIIFNMMINSYLNYFNTHLPKWWRHWS